MKRPFTKIFECSTAITWARVLSNGDVEIKNDYWYAPTKRHTMTKDKFIEWIDNCNKTEIIGGLLK